MLFPPEMPPPRFRWHDGVSASSVWLVQVGFGSGHASMNFLVRRQERTPRAEDWARIKGNSVEQNARVLILGIDPTKPPRILSRAKMSFGTSEDPVGAPLFYREVDLPCAFNRETGHFRDLPGADDLQYIQTNPVWSPDGRHIVFARARAPDLRDTKHQGFIWLTPAESSEFVGKGEPFLFDLYRIPFNDGQGGIAEPVDGASNNGMSNYFPRYSPDGRRIGQPTSLSLSMRARGQSSRFTCDS